MCESREIALEIQEIETFESVTLNLQSRIRRKFIFKNILTPWIFHSQGIYIKLFKDYFLMISSFQII